MSPATKAWLGLGAGILTWDILAPHGQTLSEQCHRWCDAHPWMVRAAIILLGIHLAAVINPRYDPIHLGFTALHR